jgi:hypothetical protein
MQTPTDQRTEPSFQRPSPDHHGNNLPNSAESWSMRAIILTTNPTNKERPISRDLPRWLEKDYKVGGKPVGWSLAWNCPGWEQIAPGDFFLFLLQGKRDKGKEWKLKWGTKAKASGKGVIVTCNGKDVMGRLGDTLPSKSKRLNDALIDLNPGFAKAFGVEPPFMLRDVSWRWADKTV